MHVLAFSHVLRRLFGNWAEPVWEWEDSALAGLCGRSLAAGLGDAVAQPVARSPY